MSGQRRGGTWIWVLLVAGVLLAVVLTPDPGRPYDLDDTGPTGYRGLQLLLESAGLKVERIDADEVAGIDPDRTTVFVPVADGAGPAVARDWSSFVRGGGRLVLGTPVDGLGAPISEDAMSSFDSGIGGFTTDGTYTADPGDCDIEGLADVRPIEGAESALPLDASAGTSCFGDGVAALVVEESLGDGRVVTVGSPDLFTNVAMGAPEPDAEVGSVPDNAVVAERLLGGGRVVAVVTDGVSDVPVTTGEKTPLDYLSSGVKLGVLQLIAAFAFYAVHRGRRHGKVVLEPVPVEIAGAEFVRAHGSLLERQADRRRTADVLRDAAVLDLCRAYGVPVGTGRLQLAQVLALRTGRPLELLAGVLDTNEVESDRDLVELSAALDSLRQEAIHV